MLLVFVGSCDLTELLLLSDTFHLVSNSKCSFRATRATLSATRSNSSYDKENYVQKTQPKKMGASIAPTVILKGVQSAYRIMNSTNIQRNEIVELAAGDKLGWRRKGKSVVPISLFWYLSGTEELKQASRAMSTPQTG